MTGLRKLFTVALLFHPWLTASTDGREPRAEQERTNVDRLSLGDLASYRAALWGRATRDDARPSDAPVRVGFRDLWERPEAFQGRRVIVHGRVERNFRQGPVGDFPPLAEVWATSPAGDPFCLVFPPSGPIRRSDLRHDVDSPHVTDRGHEPITTSTGVPERGRAVRFTGTFLKMVRYTASDGERIAPLIVGDRPPTSEPAGTNSREPACSKIGEVLRAIGGTPLIPGAGGDRWAWSPARWALGLVLAAIAAGVLAWRHPGTIRRGIQPAIRNQQRGRGAPDAPPRFVEPADDSSE
jgi:hypothetical protein